MALTPSNEYAANTIDFNKVENPTTSWLINEDTGNLELSNDNQALMRQAINILLQIERYQFPIFTRSIGMQTLDLPGQDLGLVVAKLKRRIEGCLKTDDRVIAIHDFDYEVLDKESILVTFNVETIFGNYNMEETFTL